MDNKWEWSFVRSDPNYLWLLGMIWNYTVFNGSLAICLGPKPRELMLQIALPTPTPWYFLFLSGCICDETFNGTLLQMPKHSPFPIYFSSSVCHDILTASEVLKGQTAWLAVMKRRALYFDQNRSANSERVRREQMSAGPLHFPSRAITEIQIIPIGMGSSYTL